MKSVKIFPPWNNLLYGINNPHCYSIHDIHNNIVHEVSEGMQGVSWTTSKEYINIKRAIKYAITLAHNARVKLMQLGISAISATWSHVINHKDKGSRIGR